MQIFLDTANLDEIKAGIETGLIDGVTTNPTLLAKEGKPSRKQLEEICKLVNGPVNAEITGLTADEMVIEARELRKISPNIVIKIPAIIEGFKAVKILSKEEIPTNVTLCFSLPQAIFAGKCGANYVSPFVGRLDDISSDGLSLVSDIVDAYSTYGYDTNVLVASIRHPMHVVDSISIGADVCSMPYDIFLKLFKHPLTDIGLKRFLDDWEKIKNL